MAPRSKLTAQTTLNIIAMCNITICFAITTILD